MKVTPLVMILFILSNTILAQTIHQAAPPIIIKDISWSSDIIFTNGQQRSKVIEWDYHKTTDGLHPNGYEQEMIWLMNRARQNPTAEGIWLANSGVSQIENAIKFFGVDTEKLMTEFNEIVPKPPAVFDRRLYKAAKAHSQYLIEVDDQNHDGQFERIDENGFFYSGARGSVFAYGKSPVYSHAAFNIDWGSNTDDGMQVGRGHRKAIMAISGDYTNIGIAAIDENNNETSVGPKVITANYAQARINQENHFNTFITGTIWQDYNGNQIYDEGEGIPDVTVQIEESNYFAKATQHGGYAIPILGQGTYTISFSGGINFEQTIEVETASILLDIQLCTSQMPCDRPTSTIESLPESLVKIYPNPADNFLQINWKGQSNARLSFYTATGQPLFTDLEILSKETRAIPIDHLAKGVYLMRIETPKGLLTKQIIKH